MGQPLRLVVVLRGTEGGVEEDQQENEPVEQHRFDGSATVSATDSIPAPQRPTETQRETCRDDDVHQGDVYLQRV